MNYLLSQNDVKILKAETGDVSERDIKEVSSMEDPLRKVILGFNVKMLPNVDELARESGVHVILNNVIYKTTVSFKPRWTHSSKASTPTVHPSPTLHQYLTSVERQWLPLEACISTRQHQARGWSMYIG
jgi:hypothetical protein